MRLLISAAAIANFLTACTGPSSPEPVGTSSNMSTSSGALQSSGLQTSSGELLSSVRLASSGQVLSSGATQSSLGFSSIAQGNSSGSVSSSLQALSSVMTTTSSSAVAMSSASCATTLHDSRDGKDYCTVQIGSQLWMAQNLALTTPSVGTWSCYQDQVSSCTTFGALYDWATAMALPASCNTVSCAAQIQLPHKGICPTGWHLPTTTEWSALATFAGGYTSAGAKLKANSSIWGAGRGTDDYGFGALPAGERSGSTYKYQGTDAYWWAGEELTNSSKAFVQAIVSSLSFLSLYQSVKTDAFSVRCVHD